MVWCIPVQWCAFKCRGVHSSAAACFIPVHALMCRPHHSRRTATPWNAGNTGQRCRPRACIASLQFYSQPPTTHSPVNMCYRFYLRVFNNKNNYCTLQMSSYQPPTTHSPVNMCYKFYLRVFNNKKNYGTLQMSSYS